MHVYTCMCIYAYNVHIMWDHYPEVIRARQVSSPFVVWCCGYGKVGLQVTI